MIEETNQDMDWRTLERQGDELWADTVSLKGWSDQDPSEFRERWAEFKQANERALKCYKDAYQILKRDQDAALDTVRLHRKIARHYRKREWGFQVAEKRLNEAREILREIRTWDEETYTEEALLDLEQAYLNLDRRMFEEALKNAESVIRLWSKDSLYGVPATWQILGDAYNIIGSALAYSDALESSFCETPDACWQYAEDRYPAEERADFYRRDVIINHATYKVSIGNWEEARELLASIEDRLSIEQKLVVDHNLVVANIGLGRIKEALDDARRDLRQTEETGDTVGQILAREALLKALCEMLRTSPESQHATYLEAAKRHYHQGLGFLDNLPAPDEIVSEDRLELHRVMIEIYLAAGDLERAEQIADVASQERASAAAMFGPIESEERADWEVTLALLDHARQKSEMAIKRLGEAKQFYKSEKKYGLAVNVGLKQAHLQKQLGNVTEAKQTLEEIEGLAYRVKSEFHIRRVKQLQAGPWPPDKEHRLVPACFELEIRIHAHHTGSEAYPVEAHLGTGGHFSDGTFRLDPAAMQEVALNPQAYGQQLSDALFAGSIRDAYLKAATHLEANRDKWNCLRLRLWIDRDAAELHTLPWELLRVDDVMISANAATPFSRYLPATTPWETNVTARPLRVLAVISNPVDLADYRLPPVDVEVECTLLKEALADQDVQLDFLEPPVTLSRLEAKLREGYHVLHYVGHGALGKEHSEPVLHLQKADKTTVPIKGRQISAMLARQGVRPHLVILSACESATVATEDAYIALGPQLIQRGVPAVVAMRGRISQTSARTFSRTLYERLLAHGVVDLAMNEARSALVTAERPDASVPVLFMRLKDGRLWHREDNPPKQPEQHTVFDQRGQQVGTQINVAGDYQSPPAQSIHITGDGNVVGDHSSSRVVKSGATETAEPNQPNTALLRRRLRRLDSIEIESLCLDHFPRVYDKFARGLQRGEMINLLLAHCRRHPEDANRLNELLK